MNEQTYSIMNRILENIKLFKKNEVGLNNLVTILEGSINALDENLPQEFYTAWMNSWSELEICLALGKQDIYKDDILKEVEKLNNLVAAYISK